MKDLSLMTWKEINEVDKDRSIVFAVMAPIEEHGWHLPLATDMVEGEFWSRNAAETLERAIDVDCYYLPTFSIAAASVNEFYGSFHFSMRTTYEVAYGIIDSLCCMGFKHVIMIASHADPQHQIAIEKAVRRINRKYGISALAPMGQIFMGVGTKPSEKLETFEKEYPDDFHAGWIETSSLLAIDEGYVREGYKDLPDSKISDKDMISQKKQLKAMGKYGYLGCPRVSSKELGKELNDNCVDSIVDAVTRFYKRDGYQKYSDYFLYKILPLHLGFFGKVRRKKVTG